MISVGQRSASALCSSTVTVVQLFIRKTHARYMNPNHGGHCRYRHRRCNLRRAVKCMGKRKRQCINPILLNHTIEPTLVCRGLFYMLYCIGYPTRTVHHTFTASRAAHHHSAVLSCPVSHVVVSIGLKAFFMSSKYLTLIYINFGNGLGDPLTLDNTDTPPHYVALMGANSCPRKRAYVRFKLRTSIMYLDSVTLAHTTQAR